MKTEVSLQELTELKNTCEKLYKENEELKDQLHNLHPKALREEYEQKALKAAMNLANNYLGAIFEKLGFGVYRDNFNQPIQFEQDAKYYLGNEWYEQGEKLKVEISATLKNDFKRLLVHIGYIEPEKREKVKSILDED